MIANQSNDVANIIHLFAGQYESGHFGTVVKFLNERRALKIFFQKEDSDRFRKTCDAEIAAYEKAMQCPEVSALLPKFYGRRKVTQVINEQNKDISSDYILDCCYEMELLDGPFYKIGIFPYSPNIISLKTKFNNIGINYLEDASVVIDDNQYITKVIDFAVEEIKPP